MKKTATYLLCSVMLLCALSACGKTNGNTSPTPTTSAIITSTPKPTATMVPTQSPTAAPPTGSPAASPSGSAVQTS